MRDYKVLMIHVFEGNITCDSEAMDRLRALPLPSGSVRTERENDRHETCISPRHSEEPAKGQPQLVRGTADAFLSQYVSSAVLEIFPEWQGILLDFPMLEETVWIVRDHQSGRSLAQETGKPFIHIDEILTREGQTPEEMLEVVLSQRKAARGKAAKRKKHTINKI